MKFKRSRPISAGELIEESDDAQTRVEELDHLLKAEACLLSSDGQFLHRVDS